MPDKKSKDQEYIPGIHCDAVRCAYNDKNCNCYAKEINVAKNSATNSEDTECTTFRMDK